MSPAVPQSHYVKMVGKSINVKPTQSSRFYVILWKCRESNSSPNPSMRENLRRVVSVIFKAGCEERRRNHSCPIPYLIPTRGNARDDSTDNSAHPSCCRTQGKMNVAWRESLDLRKREREITHTEVWRLHACKSVLGKFVFPRF